MKSLNCTVTYCYCTYWHSVTFEWGVGMEVWCLSIRTSLTWSLSSLIWIPYSEPEGALDVPGLNMTSIIIHQTLSRTSEPTIIFLMNKYQMHRPFICLPFSVHSYLLTTLFKQGTQRLSCIRDLFGHLSESPIPCLPRYLKSMWASAFIFLPQICLNSMWGYYMYWSTLSLFFSCPSWGRLLSYLLQF